MKTEAGVQKTFTIAEVAGILGMPLADVERVIAEGKLAATTEKGQTTISEEAINDFRSAYFNVPGASF